MLYDMIYLNFIFVIRVCALFDKWFRATRDSTAGSGAVHGLQSSAGSINTVSITSTDNCIYIF